MEVDTDSEFAEDVVKDQDDGDVVMDEVVKDAIGRAIGAAIGASILGVALTLVGLSVAVP